MNCHASPDTETTQTPIFGLTSNPTPVRGSLSAGAPLCCTDGCLVEAECPWYAPRLPLRQRRSDHQVMTMQFPFDVTVTFTYRA